MTPVDNFPEQERAFLLLHAAIADTATDAPFPTKGTCSNKVANISWTWDRDEKSKKSKAEFTVQKNKFRRIGHQPITISVPLEQRDTNTAGLIARDTAGKLYLCRERFGDYTANDPVQDALIGDDWTGRKYPAFVVTDPSPTTQSRLYFACISLDEGSTQILSDLGQLLDSYAIWSQNRLPTRTRPKATEEMSVFYKANKLSLPKDIVNQRENIITSLMKGLSAEEAFEAATAALLQGEPGSS